MDKAPEAYYRFCPGEEHNKISDAICVGRRRVKYAKCKGCQFNDDEHGAPSFVSQVLAIRRASPLSAAADTIDRVFKAYDVRATVPDPLNQETAWRVGNATAQFLRSVLLGYNRADSDMQTLIVGRDMRKHSPMLSRSLIDGVLASETRVIDIGMIDTPQIYFAVNHITCCGGVQTTASHNPANYNGFKICGPKGKPIGSETGLKEIQRIARAISPYPLTNGMQARPMDLSEAYRSFLLKFLKPLRPLKVVVDASNGMAGRWVPIIFSNIPNLTILPLNFEHNGDFAHPPDPLVPQNLDQLRAAVRESRADFGACFDGDADRCIFVDDHAEIVRCDHLTALLARAYLREKPGATIVYDLRSSRVVAEEVIAAGGKPKRERVGHVFMKRTMAETNGVFGGELSGHFYYRDFFFCDSGAMTLIAVLNLLTQSGAALSELIRPLGRFAASGERNFENEDKDGTMARIADRYSDARVDRLDGVTIEYADWWFNIRPSNTEPLLRLNMEAADPGLLAQKLAELTPLLGAPALH